jgi:hypothetical protein
MGNDLSAYLVGAYYCLLSVVSLESLLGRPRTPARLPPGVQRGSASEARAVIVSKSRLC